MTKEMNTGVRLTDQTLAEQLKITDRDIEDRKRLVGFSNKDVTELISCKAYVQEHLAEIVDEFYDFQKTIPEIQLLIGDAETFRRLHGSMKRYVLELFEGFYDSEYVNRRLRIGKVHKAIGVSPKLYISSLARLETILHNHISQISISDMEVTFRRSAALRRLLSLDVQFVFDTYINSMVSEVETAKKEVELYAETLEEAVADRTRQLEELSRTDSLTKLHNQRSFFDNLRHELAVAERNNRVLSLMYFDLNSFKALNDTKGHRTGDELLAYVGNVLLATARASDICCRYGGDEFCVIMPDTARGAGDIFCQRLQDSFDKGETHGVTFSIGVAETGPEKFLTMEEFIRTADEAMYQAKAASRIEQGHHVRHRSDQDQDKNIRVVK
jgi:diguanylate cyclase (GGDEF)-like protein